MKYKGKVIASVNTKTIRLQKGDDVLDIQVASVSPGFTERLTVLGLMEQPVAPSVVVKDAKGRAKTDENGNVVKVQKLDDPNYKRAIDKWYDRYIALQIADHLRTDENLVFDAVKPESSEKVLWETYADALHSEIYGEGGLTDDEASQILRTGRELGCVVVEVEKEVDDFLPNQSSE